MAAAQSWDVGMGPVPEEVLLDVNLAIGTGYGSAKYVTERVCFVLLGALVDV